MLCIPILEDVYYTTTGTRRQHYLPTMRLINTPELDEVDLVMMAKANGDG
jgi:hypothetical protein